jgi:hypothetical protein
MVGDHRMLTRDKLTDAEWFAVRNTPYLAMLAVSAKGGSAFDDMLERKAGVQGIVDGAHSTHPILRDVAADIMHAQDDVTHWLRSHPDAARTPALLHAKALESMQQALDAVAAYGTAHDVHQYADFVIGVASRVSKAAREGDVMGMGGKVVSESEGEFLAQLERLAQAKGA